MPKVSVILTTYNRPQMLEKAINSVLNQSYQDFELFIMDDNSDDSYQNEILDRYSDNDKVHIYKSNITDENRRETVRYSVLINQALSKASGELIAYICDDDFYSLDRLERMVNWFDNNPDKHFLMGDQFCVKKDGEELIPMPQHIRSQPESRKDPNCNVDHTSVMHRKSVIDKIGKWTTDKMFWGSADGEFYQKAVDAGYIFYGLGGHPTDTHVYHNGSWTKDKNHEKLGTSEEKSVSQA